MKQATLIDARIARVLIASIPGWSRTAKAAWTRGDRREAIAAGRHVTSLMTAYRLAHEPGHVVYREGHGGAGGLFEITRIIRSRRSQKPQPMARRLYADGRLGREYRF